VSVRRVGGGGDKARRDGRHAPRLERSGRITRRNPPSLGRVYQPGRISRRSVIRHFDRRRNGGIRATCAIPPYGCYSALRVLPGACWCAVNAACWTKSADNILASLKLYCQRTLDA